MTKEEAIEVLHELDGSLYETQQVALDMAIKALEQQPSDDCVSRQAVINITWQDPTYTDPLNVLTEVRDKVKALPPVTPIIPKGATNGDMLTALFGENALITLDTHNYLKKWWNAPYKRGDENEVN